VAKRFPVTLGFTVFLLGACTKAPEVPPPPAPPPAPALPEATKPTIQVVGAARSPEGSSESPDSEWEFPPLSKETIEGTLVDREGRPLEGIEVRAYPDKWGWGRPAWSHAKTDDKGRFRIAELREESHRVQALEDGFRPFGPTWSSAAESEAIQDVRPGRRDLRLVLLPPGSIKGTVALMATDATNCFPPAIDLYIVPASEDGAVNPFGSLGGVVAVPCRFDGNRLLPDKPREGVRPTSVVEWGNGKEPAKEHVKEIDGGLDEVPYSYRIRDDRVEVDDKGRFRAHGLRQGRWRLEADDIRALPGAVDFEVSAGRTTEVALPLRYRGWLDVRVKGPDGRPLEGACVVVLDPEGAPASVLVETVVLSRHGGMHSGNSLLELFNAITTTDDEGKTRPRYLAPGSHRVRVLSERLRPFEAIVKIAEGKATALEVRLEPER
jgi:hypothetical protein